MPKENEAPRPECKLFVTGIVGELKTDINAVELQLKSMGKILEKLDVTISGNGVIGHRELVRRVKTHEGYHAKIEERAWTVGGKIMAGLAVLFLQFMFGVAVVMYAPKEKDPDKPITQTVEKVEAKMPKNSP